MISGLPIHPPLESGEEEEQKREPGGLEVQLSLRWTSIRGDEEHYTIAMVSVHPTNPEDFASLKEATFAAGNAKIEKINPYSARITPNWAEEDAELTISVTATGQVSSPTGEIADREGSDTETVEIIGANPTLTLEPSVDTIDLDGRSEVDVRPHLKLFGHSYSDDLQVTDFEFDDSFFKKTGSHYQEGSLLRAKFHLDGDRDLRLLGSGDKQPSTEVRLGVLLKGKYADHYPSGIEAKEPVKIGLEPSCIHLPAPDHNSLPTDGMSYKTRLRAMVVSVSGRPVSGEDIRRDWPESIFKRWRFSFSYDPENNGLPRAWDFAPGRWPPNPSSTETTATGVDDRGWILFRNKGEPNPAPSLEYDHWAAFYNTRDRYLEGQCCILKATFEVEGRPLDTTEIFIGPPCKLYVYADMGGPDEDLIIGHVFPGLIDERGNVIRVGFFDEQSLMGVDADTGTAIGAVGGAVISGLGVYILAWMTGGTSLLATGTIRVIAAAAAAAAGATVGAVGGALGIGRMRNDNNRPYNVCRGWDITKEEYHSALAKMKEWKKFSDTNQLIYDISAQTFFGNCVSFTHDVCTAAGVQLPFARNLDLSRPTNVGDGIRYDKRYRDRREENPGYSNDSIKRPWTYGPGATKLILDPDQVLGLWKVKDP